ncbi:hypothetical protein [Paenibacillus massiliensis]|uniref:hypothetical protein n=1 Tax=Paenibacillus massiliensis TaxID=225917 RepID=UPI00037F0445|nr:hypothetical protein [Paenibacillus massiliensis]
MNIHVIQAVDFTFETSTIKAKNAILFISEKHNITFTTHQSYLDTKNMISKADHVIVSNEWSPHAYIDFAIAIELNKRVVVINEPERIESPLFPYYKDVTFEISSETSFIEYLNNLED